MWTIRKKILLTRIQAYYIKTLNTNIQLLTGIIGINFGSDSHCHTNVHMSPPVWDTEIGWKYPRIHDRSKCQPFISIFQKGVIFCVVCICWHSLRPVITKEMPTSCWTLNFINIHSALTRYVPCSIVEVSTSEEYQEYSCCLPIENIWHNHTGWKKQMMEIKKLGSFPV